MKSQIYILFLLTFNLSAMQWKNPHSLQWLAAIAVAKQTTIEDIHPSKSFKLSEMPSLSLRANLKILENATKKRKKTIASSMGKFTRVLPLLHKAFIFCNQDSLPKITINPDILTGLQHHLSGAEKIYTKSDIVLFLKKNYLNAIFQANIENETATELFNTSLNIKHLAISNSKKFIIFDDGRETVYKKIIGRFELPKELFKYNGSVTSLAISPDDTLLALGFSNGEVLIQRLTSTSNFGYCRLKIHDGPVFALDFDSEGKLLASGGADKMVYITEILTQEIIWGCKDSMPVLTVKFDPWGKFVIYGNETIKLKDWADNTKLIEFEQDILLPFEIVFDTNNSKIICIFKDGTILSWKDPINYRYLNLSLEQLFLIKNTLNQDFSKMYIPTSLSSATMQLEKDPDHYRPTTKNVTPVERAKRKMEKFKKQDEFWQLEPAVQKALCEKLDEQLINLKLQETNVDQALVEKKN